ncbi:MAG: glycosyltransferase [Elusimicrobiota bacterium]
MFWSMPISWRFPFWLHRLAENVDIIHFHFPFPLALLSNVFFSRSKILITWHSDIIRQKVLAALLRPLIQRALAHATAVITTSQSMIRTSNMLAGYRKKCRVIPLGIDPSPYKDPAQPQHPSEIASARAAGLPIILFVGRLVPYKGVDILIHALTRMRTSCRALIIGDGPLKDDLAALATNLGISDKIVFLGPLKDKALISYYQNSDIFVLPSVQASEAFGIVQLEAMACGIPVINTDLPTGVPEVSLDGQTGLTVKVGDPQALADALDRLVTDIPLRKRLGENAKKRVHDLFTIEMMVEATASLYREVMGN